MEIRKIVKKEKDILNQLKKILVKAFPHSYSNCADEEIEQLTSSERILIGAFDKNSLLGFIGAIPQYGNTGWELHPIVVKEDCQCKGIGTFLLKSLEEAVAEEGGITIYLGTDDEFGKTSLSYTDLFENMYEKIQNIKNFNRHPYEFYKKNGYIITGVIPDANGLGKPDIIMAKNITKIKGK